MMNVLVIGSGGREHALCWKIKQSSLLGKLHIAPGNAGTANLGENIALDIFNFKELAEFCLVNAIDLVLVGPEDPLDKGIYDYLKQYPGLEKLVVVGPSQKGAQLESSKSFAKEFMQKHGIPTAAYQSFTAKDIQSAKTFLTNIAPPYVIKADGLAAGKGVFILDKRSEAEAILDEILLHGKFGGAGNTVVIEEFLDGIEVSVFAITDGENYVLLPEAKDYKRIGEGDSGLNTGGMGAVSPVSFMNKALWDKIIHKVVRPTIKGIKADEISYKGFVFFGLIVVDNEPFVIEYNVRMGDPETQVVIPRIKNDLLDVFVKMDSGKLSEVVLDTDVRAAATVILVSGGYPENYEKNKDIFGLENIHNSMVFHAGTLINKGQLKSNGGRVLAVSSYGDTIHLALKKSYQSIEKIDFENMYFRKDIGFDLKSN